MKFSKIALIGFMGSGKSSVGAALATLLAMRFVDLDSLVLQRSGYLSISEIFKALGEHEFRRLESEVALSLSDATQLVIATGGGIIGRHQNIEALKNSGGVCVLLHVSFPEALRRALEVSDRPLLHDLSAAEKLFIARQPVYQEYADLSVQTDGKTVKQICSEILSHLS